MPTSPASPSERTAGRLASENGPTRVKKVSRSGAARWRSASSGVCSSASSPRRAIVGRSSSRNSGKRWKFARSSLRRVAEISAASPASRTQRTTSRLFFSSSLMTVSESVMKFLMTLFWSPRMRSTFEVSRRPGCARRSTSWRSSGRPARPVPSSVTISRKRSRYGRRMMSLTMSVGIVEEVCSTGTMPPVGEPLVRLAGLAVHVVLADQRLRPDLAARVLAEVAEARLRDLDGHDRLGRLALLLLDLEVRRLAGVHAAHAEVAALDESERVVELDLVGLALRSPGPRPRRA